MGNYNRRDTLSRKIICTDNWYCWILW